MYKKIADHVSDSLVTSGAISRSEINVYSYAAELLLSSITGLVICLGIGVIFGAFVGSVIFLAVYCPLRQFSGGYHAANHISCALIFCLAFLVNTLIAQYAIAAVDFQSIVTLMLAGLSVATINILSPIEDRNKPLNQNEKAKFRKKAMMLSIIVLFLIILFVKLQLGEASYYACSAVFMISMLLVMGKIKNTKGEKDEKVVCEICSADGSNTDDACYSISK